MGTSGFAQFKFTAATNTNSLNGLNKFTLSGVIFNVNATNVTLSPSLFKIYNRNDASTKVTCVSRYSADGIAIGSSGTASGSFLVDCQGLKGSTISTSINSGDSAIFVLEGNIINSKVGTANSALQGSIQNFTSLTNATGYASNSSTKNQMEWLDEDTATTIFYWLEYQGTEVKSTSYKS